MRSVIEAIGLTKRFAGLSAVSDVSLSCEPGVIHAVIGPNGAGKSTLINFFSKKEITAPIRNKLMMTWSSEKIFYNQREKREKLRIKNKRKHRVYYFHCLSDPYSHLTSQVIKKLISNFDVELEIMFISFFEDILIKSTALFIVLKTLIFLKIGLGILAKFENSFTSFSISFTCLLIVSKYFSNS